MSLEGHREILRDIDLEIQRVMAADGATVELGVMGPNGGGTPVYISPTDNQPLDSRASIAQLVVWHESERTLNGARIPARPIRQGFTGQDRANARGGERYQEKFLDEFEKQLGKYSKGEITLAAALDKAGKEGKMQMVAFVLSEPFEDLSPDTIQSRKNRKFNSHGGSIPLADTLQILKHINYNVVLK